MAKVPWVLESGPTSDRKQFTFLVEQLQSWPHCELLLCYPALRRIFKAPVEVLFRLQYYRGVMTRLNRWRPRTYDPDIASFTSRQERHNRRARPLIGHDLKDGVQPLRARQVLMMSTDDFDAMCPGFQPWLHDRG
jgi:hypothetical protein